MINYALNNRDLYVKDLTSESSEPIGTVETLSAISNTSPELRMRYDIGNEGAEDDLQLYLTHSPAHMRDTNRNDRRSMSSKKNIDYIDDSPTEMDQQNDNRFTFMPHKKGVSEGNMIINKAPPERMKIDPQHRYIVLHEFQKFKQEKVEAERAEKLKKVLLKF